MNKRIPIIFVSLLAAKTALVCAAEPSPQTNQLPSACSGSVGFQIALGELTKVGTKADWSSSFQTVKAAVTNDAYTIWSVRFHVVLTNTFSTDPFPVLFSTRYFAVSEGEEGLGALAAVAKPADKCEIVGWLGDGATTPQNDAFTTSRTTLTVEKDGQLLFVGRKNAKEFHIRFLNSGAMKLALPSQ